MGRASSAAEKRDAETMLHLYFSRRQLMGNHRVLFSLSVGLWFGQVSDYAAAYRNCSHLLRDLYIAYQQAAVSDRLAGSLDVCRDRNL